MTATTYNVHTIETTNDISRCPAFYVDCFNWGGDYRPVTYEEPKKWDISSQN